MPQMAPLNWLSLYFLFFILYLIFMIINYYSFYYLPKNSLMVSKKFQINWKW